MGMEAQVSLQFAPREKYGYIKGYVSDIEAYAASGDALSQSFNNIVRDMVNAEAVYHIVQITLLPDTDSKNGLRCSNPQGGALPVEVGTRCQTDIIYGSDRPYEWLLDRR